jgi:hypothetical protein
MTDIPDPVKRLVRQQAGFGCCKCGLPIIEYHHIVKETTNPEEIMLLCPICHHEATVGAMLQDEQFFHKKNPKNIKEGRVEGNLKINHVAPAVTLGANQFIGTGALLIVDGESLLSLDVVENRLEVSMKLYDQNDNLVISIVRNEWTSGDPLPWDLEASFQWLRIKRKVGNISLSIDARKYPMEIVGDLWRKGQNFKLKPDELLFNGVRTQVGFLNLGFVAVSLQVDTAKKVFSIVPDSRYKGAFVSNSNVAERVRLGLENWKEISCTHEYSVFLDRSHYSMSKCTKCGKIKKDWKGKYALL